MCRATRLQLCLIGWLAAVQPLSAQTWVQKVGGIGLGNPLTFRISDTDVLYGAAGSDQVFISRTRGYGWTPYGVPIPGSGVIKALAVNPADTLQIVAGVESGGGTPDRVMKSTDGGLSWAQTWGGNFSYYGRPVAFQPLHPERLYTMGGDTIWVSTDFGSTWDTVAHAVGFNTWCDAEIRTDSANILLAGDNLSGVWRSRDYGVSWKKVYSTLGEIPSIALDPFDGRFGFAARYGGGGGLIRTTDGGITWSPSPVPSGSRDAWWVTYSNVHPGYLYYGTYTADTTVAGMYFSRDNGAHWTRYRAGLGASSLYNYGLLALDSLTVIALQSSGLYKLQFPTSIHIIAPAGGEELAGGSTFTIQWTSTGLYAVRLEYSTDGGIAWLPVADSIDAWTGSYAWSVPVMNATACLLRISDARFTLTSATSDSSFIISNASIRLLAPNGGETWITGNHRFLTWLDTAVAEVALDYSTDGGGTWLTITTRPGQSSPYIWNVPPVNSTSCRIRISSVANPSLADSSDSLFTIRQLSSFTASLNLAGPGGAHDSLRFGSIPGATDGIDTLFGEHELPAPPPAGVFDIRWMIGGTRGSRTDYRDTVSVLRPLNIFHPMLQPGLAGYPLNLQWNPESLTAGTFILRDVATGGNLLSADMRIASSATFNDASQLPIEIVECSTMSANIPGGGGWRLIAVPFTVADRRTSALFPYASSAAYNYLAGYRKTDTLEYGKGYWIKTAQTTINGCMLAADSFGVRAGWNMVGSLSSALPVAGITTIPGGILLSPFYGYDNGYHVSDTLYPGQGYWIKTSSAGSIHIPTETRARLAEGDGTRLDGMSSLTVGDGRGDVQKLYFGVAGQAGENHFEMPPAPPWGEFDVRFASGALAALHPEFLQKEAEYPISLFFRGEKIFFSWRVDIEKKFTYILIEKVGNEVITETPLEHIGDLILEKHPNATFAIKVRHATPGSTQTPLQCSLGNCFPNPCNPTTRAKFDVAVDGFVRITVTNVLGEEVATLVEGSYPRGTYTAQWNGLTGGGSVAGSGVYFIRMSVRPDHPGGAPAGAGGGMVRKVLLLK